MCFLNEKILFMKSKAMTEAKVRITLLLLIWAIICLTSLLDSPSLLKSEFESNITPKVILEYFAANE